MTDTKYVRRTFKEVAEEAYAKGWGEGRLEAREGFDKSWELLQKRNNDTTAELLLVQCQLDNISLRKLAWSRITGLFKGRNDRLA